jgi:dienelactone hydrolase
VLAVGLAHAASADPARVSHPARAPQEPCQSVGFKTSDELSIRADFYPARANGQLAPAAILIHDAGGTRAQLGDLASRMQRQGFAVLALDLRGHGDSGGRATDWRELDDAGRKTLWAFATRDVEAAAQWMRGQKGIHTTNLSMIGVGAGCALAVRHAARDENVRCVALLAPNPADYGYDVAAELFDLEGLPTLVMTPRGASNETERMVENANAKNGGTPYIEVEFSGSKVETVLQDKRMPTVVAKWLKDRATPQRSSRGR